MKVLFVSESIKDGLKAYGQEIRPELTYEKLTELLDTSDQAYLIRLTQAVLAKISTVFRDNPFDVAGLKGTKGAGNLQVNTPEFNEIFAATGLSTNTVECLQVLNCVVTMDNVLLLTMGSTPNRDQSFLERVITSLAETKSIDDVMAHEVSVYHCKISS